MKNKWMIGAFALLSFFTLSLTSCDDDDKPTAVANVTFSDVEVGKENSREAMVGKDLHVECGIKSEAKIKSIEMSLIQKNGTGSAYRIYTDGKYVGVLNTKFHEHLELSAGLAAGTYHFTLTVTDANNAKKAYETDVTLKAVDANAPKVEILSPSASANSGVAGGKFTVKAKLTVKSAVKGIEIEFHGDKEYPIKVDDFNGKTGSIDFEKEITIPAECAAGKYHVHVTVEDADGRSTTEEFKGFNITK